MKLFENDLYELNLDIQTPCLEWIGKKFMVSSDFRESELKSLELYKKHKPAYPGLEWYVDARNIGPIAPEDTKWIVDVILPEFAAAGLRKEAFVVPKSALGRLVVKNYTSKAGDIIEIKVFPSEKEAKTWLTS